MASLSDVEQRGLDDDRVMIYRRKTEELYGVMVMLTADRSRSVH
jgi:negative regulator of genetic competence, sporulation and motility